MFRVPVYFDDFGDRPYDRPSCRRWSNCYRPPTPMPRYYEPSYYFERPCFSQPEDDFHGQNVLNFLHPLIASMNNNGEDSRPGREERKQEKECPEKESCCCDTAKEEDEKDRQTNGDFLTQLLEPMFKNFGDAYRQKTATARQQVWKYHVDCSGFDSSNIFVKISNGNVIVRAVKKEKARDGSVSTRSMEKVTPLPKNIVTKKVSCRMLPNSFLQIEAPLKTENIKPKTETKKNEKAEKPVLEKPVSKKDSEGNSRQRYVMRVLPNGFIVFSSIPEEGEENVNGEMEKKKTDAAEGTKEPAKATETVKEKHCEKRKLDDKDVPIQVHYTGSKPTSKQPKKVTETEPKQQKKPQATEEKKPEEDASKEKKDEVKQTQEDEKEVPIPVHYAGSKQPAQERAKKATVDTSEKEVTESGSPKESEDLPSSTSHVPQSVAENKEDSKPLDEETIPMVVDNAQHESECKAHSYDDHSHEGEEYTVAMEDDAESTKSRESEDSFVLLEPQGTSVEINVNDIEKDALTEDHTESKQEDKQDDKEEQSNESSSKSKFVNMSQLFAQVPELQDFFENNDTDSFDTQDFSKMFTNSIPRIKDLVLPMIESLDQTKQNEKRSPKKTHRPTTANVADEETQPEEFCVRLEMPLCIPESIRVAMDDQRRVLNISASTDCNKQVHKTIEVPHAVDETKVKCQFTDGLLSICAPYRTPGEAKDSRNIPVVC